MTTEIVEDVSGWSFGRDSIESDEYREWFDTLASVATFDEAVSVGIDLSVTSSDARMRLGDLANTVVVVKSGIDRDAATKKTTLVEFAKATRCEYSSLKEAARVARSVEWGVRVSFRGVLYSHWRCMVRFGVKGTDLVEFAKKVEDDNLSVKALEAILTKHVTGEERDGGKRADDWLAMCSDKARHLNEEDIRQCYESRDGVISDDIVAIRKVLEAFETLALAEPRTLVEDKPD